MCTAAAFSLRARSDRNIVQAGCCKALAEPQNKAQKKRIRRNADPLFRAFLFPLSDFSLLISALSFLLLG